LGEYPENGAIASVLYKITTYYLYFAMLFMQLWGLDNLTWISMAIVSGLPATVVPIGLCESGLPVGIQIIGARLEDRTTFSFAQGLSDLVGGFKAPPNFIE
jgi:Asp-tRNA(Asn)/Glu-tRNA(Gln) amidotransferase A subunit family amidase